MKKSIFKSKTMWLNAIMALVAVAAFINPELLTALGFSTENQQSVLTIVGTITALLNIVLRMATTKPLKFKKEIANEVE